MTKLTKISLVLGLALVIAVPVAAQGKKEKKKGQAKNALAKMVDDLKSKAGLSEDQLKKVNDLAEKYGAVIAEANKALGEDTLKALQQARKAAADQGKKGKEVDAAVAAAVTLTDDQKSAQKKAADARAAFTADVREILTAEQIEKAGLAKKKKKNA